LRPWRSASHGTPPTAEPPANAGDDSRCNGHHGGDHCTSNGHHRGSDSGGHGYHGRDHHRGGSVGGGLHSRRHHHHTGGTGNAERGGLNPRHEPTRSRAPGPLPGGVCREAGECEGQVHTIQVTPPGTPDKGGKGKNQNNLARALHAYMYTCARFLLSWKLTTPTKRGPQKKFKKNFNDFNNLQSLFIFLCGNTCHTYHNGASCLCGGGHSPKQKSTTGRGGTDNAREKSGTLIL